MTFTFDNNNTFRNVGIHNENNELIVMNINASSDNISLHSSSNDKNVDIMSIKTLLNKHQNKELHLSAYDGSTINPIIKINNTHQHVNIMSNLNVTNKLYISDDSGEYSSIGLNMERSAGDDRTHNSDCMVEFRCHHSKYNAFVDSTNYSTSRLRLVSGGYYEIDGANNIDQYHNCVIEMIRAGPIVNGDTKFKTGYFFIKHDGNFYMTGDTHSITLNVQNKVIASGSELTSDDRLKFNEELLLNVTETLLKLRPQKYDKANELINPINYNKESGFIAQEIYYEIPELRYLINVPVDATLIDDNKYRNFSDIQNDPDYSNWGSTPASVNYISIIPYIVSGFQEHNTRIVNLENENSTLKSENQLLKTQVNELTNIINKLKTTNSFEEFKQTL